VKAKRISQKNLLVNRERDRKHAKRYRRKKQGRKKNYNLKSRQFWGHFFRRKDLFAHRMEGDGTSITSWVHSEIRGKKGLSRKITIRTKNSREEK